ncbi:MAG: hypothetical protein RIQ60_1473 [Pseudomonadota bacterium]|jgi:amidase
MQARHTATDIPAAATNTGAEGPPGLRSAHALAGALRRREISAVALLEHFIARVERLDGTINAVVVRDIERARARAEQADAALARGACWGPLHGLPMTVKESFDLPGLPTTWGDPAYRGNIATRPAVAVERLQAAGAVIFGKTNVPVALADWQSFNPIYGTTHNPWDTGRTPGGSSGGSAAALAAGLTALELGSDIGASIRNPAHYCGVYGHKPTWGVLPMAGHALPGMADIDSLDIAVAGPLARSAADLQLAMDVLCSPLQAYSPVHGWQPARWRDAGLAPRQLRVLVLTDDAQARCDTSVRQGLQQLADFLREQGLKVSEVDASAPDHPDRPVDSLEHFRTYSHLLRAATGAHLSDADWAAAQRQAAALAPGRDDFVAWHWRAVTTSHRDWVHHDETRVRLRRQWAAFFERFDLLICPVATTPAFAHMQTGLRWERMVQVDGQDQPSTDSLFWAGYAGLCGLPATAIPLGLSQQPESAGLPVGAQIIGPVMGDPVGLRLAAWLEQHWRAFQPPALALR